MRGRTDWTHRCDPQRDSVLANPKKNPTEGKQKLEPRSSRDNTVRVSRVHNIEEEPDSTTAVEATAVETLKFMDSLIQKKKRSFYMVVSVCMTFARQTQTHLPRPWF